MAGIRVRAPGRVNLIGEHVDHCGGAVLPLALSLGVTVEAAPRDDGVVTVRSAAFDDAAVIPPGADPRSVRPPWARYAAGVLAAWRECGVGTPGFDAVVTSDLPVGAGLASSAAFDVAFARVVAAVAGAEPDDALVVDVCVWAEELASGVRCGIMDPSAALFAEPGHALLLDCATGERRSLEVAGFAVVVADSGVRHELAASEYNRRRADCEGALALLRAAGVDAEHLAHVPPAALGDVALPPPLDRRARHVVSEHGRTLAAADALLSRDAAAFGALLDASHASLRDDFEVSCAELDRLVAAARAVPGVHGSRMTGGGFGGCTVTAVAPDAVDRLLDALRPLCGPAGAFRVLPAGAP